MHGFGWNTYNQLTTYFYNIKSIMVYKNLIYLTLVLLLLPISAVSQSNPWERQPNKYVIAYSSPDCGETETLLMFIPVAYCKYIYNRLPETAQKTIDACSEKYRDFGEKPLIKEIENFPGAIVVPTHMVKTNTEELHPVSLFIEDYGVICQGLMDHAIFIYDMKTHKYRDYKVVSSDTANSGENVFEEDNYITVKAYWNESRLFDDPWIYSGKVNAKYL